MMVRQREQKKRAKAFWDKNIETLERAKLVKLQEERLREQLEYVYEFSKFYKDKFIKAGFHPHDFKSMEDIQRIPKTNKDELRQAALESGNPLPHLCVPKSEISGFGISRGTTGMSTFAAFTQGDLDLRVECYTRSLQQIGLSSNDLFHSMMGIQSVTHFILKEVARNLNVKYINDGVDNPSSSVQIGRWLKPNVLFTGVRTLLEMEKVLEAEELLPKEVFSYETAILYGDVIGSHLIDHVKERWNIREIFSLSGSAGDLLWYNFDCPYHTGNHCLNEDMFLVEVINSENGHPVKSGEKGELLVTDLCSKGAPHIRWNLEDVVIPYYEPCQCGRTHVRLNYLGRALYELHIKGKTIFPAEVEHFLWKIREIEGAQFRIVKYATEMDHLKLQIEFSQKENKTLKRRICQHLKEKLKLEVDIEFVGPGELPVMDVKTPRVLDLT
ncbi:MAG: hypothetical protein JRJ83_08625 [Deltaproteobacteria bacterium]|nr:hypothetical protein [Deltaproteobacteria bacterium]